MRQQIRSKRKVSRKYSCSFSHIDWGFRSSLEDIAANDSDHDDDVNNDRPVLQQQHQTMMAVDNVDGDCKEVLQVQRSTVVSEGSTATMDTAASRMRVSHRTLVTALNSWKGSLRGIFVHVPESHGNDSDSGSDDEEEGCCSVDTTSVTACTLTCFNEEKQDCSGEVMELQQQHDEQHAGEQETQIMSDEALLEQWAESVTNHKKSTISSSTAPLSNASSNIDDSERSRTLEEDMFLHWDGSLARCQHTTNNNKKNEDVISIFPPPLNAPLRGESSGSFSVDAEGFLHWDASRRLHS